MLMLSLAALLALAEPPALQLLDAPGAPEVTAKAWVILDAATGECRWGKAADTPAKAASTTKVMCARVVLNLAAADPAVLAERVTFSKLADDTGGSTAGVRAGESVPVADLLYGLLLPSGNDAGNALAEHFNARLAPPDAALAEAVGLDPGKVGTRINFLAEMTREARRLGLTETSYRIPFGDSGDPAVMTTTPRELAALAWQCMKDERFRAIVGTKTYSCRVRASDGIERTATWENTNRLLGKGGYDGVKTGTTNTAGSCLVASGRKGDDRLIVVVLGSKADADRYADAAALFAWAWAKRAER